MGNLRYLVFLAAISTGFLPSASRASADDAAPAATVAPERAVKVDMRGGLVGFDAAAYQAVIQEMGSLVGSGVVDQFVTYSYGKEGGTRFCAQLSPRAASIAQVSDRLQAIHVDPDLGTTFEITPVRDCSEYLARGVLPVSG